MQLRASAGVGHESAEFEGVNPNQRMWGRSKRCLTRDLHQSAAAKSGNCGQETPLPEIRCVFPVKVDIRMRMWCALQDAFVDLTGGCMHHMAPNFSDEMVSVRKVVAHMIRRFCSQSAPEQVWCWACFHFIVASYPFVLAYQLLKVRVSDHATSSFDMDTLYSTCDSAQGVSPMEWCVA